LPYTVAAESTGKIPVIAGLVPAIPFRKWCAILIEMAET
jgi:hypothetical protein